MSSVIIFDSFQGGVSVHSNKSTPEVRCRCSTRRLGTEGELELSVVEDTIASALVLRVQVSKPSDSSTRITLKLLALGIQEVKVILFLLHVGDSGGRGGTSRAGLHRGPTVLRQDDLLAVCMGINPV